MTAAKATRQLTIGTPCTWLQRTADGTVYMSIYAKIVDVRPDGRYIVRYVGKSGRPVKRIASAASVVAR